MNPREFFEEGKIRPPLPGENWNMTKEEAHCFDFELRRLQMHTDVETPAVSHWIGLVKQALKSGKAKTNSTAELFAYVQGSYPAALVYLTALQPENPEDLRAMLESEYLREEHGITLEEAEARFANAEADVFRLPLCDHLAMEHAALIVGWYVRNLEDTRYRQATLYSVWQLPAKEVLYGKQFFAQYDLDREVKKMEPEIQAFIDEANRQIAERMDPETKRQLVEIYMRDDGLSADKAEEKADAFLEGMRGARSRNMRNEFIAKYAERFRILE